MMNANPYQQYRQNAVMSAGKGDLTLMLYNGAIKFIKQSIKFVDEKNIEGSHNTIVRVQDIIAHLNETLNMDYEISKNLELLYDYVNRRLVEANIKKDSNILREVLGLVEDLRNTWSEALKLSGSASAASL
ncbi:MAG: flagellar export chaperone FliS [Firmicutes bacterium]|nr:flagellar export chaperone FliS [Bacillota bacterium]